MNTTLVFDIDDTLCDNSWYRLNTAAGVTSAEDYALYQGFSRCDFNYQEWTNRLADIYRGRNILTEKIAGEVLRGYTIKGDAMSVIAALKDRGYEIILITGGFGITAEHLGTQLGLKNYFATSNLEFATDGTFINISTAIDDGEAKVSILKNYLLQTGKSVQGCTAIGDSSNDIPLFNFTKNGIAFDWSKDSVKISAKQTISTLSDLLNIL